MPCLAQELHPRPPAAASHYCKSLSSLIRETYAHCHVPCVRVPAGAGWSSGEDSDDDDSGLDEALDTKQVVLTEMRNRQMKKRSRCSLDSPTLPLSSAAFAWSYTPLDPRTVIEKVSSPKTCVVVEGTEEKAKEKEEEEAAGDDGHCDADDDDESEAFFSVKSFFTRSTSRAATVASSSAGMMMDPPPPMLRSPEAWERFRDCEGWPFGLCRRPAVLPLPPLPSTPADSWKWRKSASSLAASPAPAYTHKLAGK
ncbi:hypothetical protein GQ55_2G281200 [Panicum hallii var. hallii]|uniref:Uncharacterized protein n=1 Tax=Panicum hallii var. hallii TaxID=1504633 RepID=A0A2T7ET64_9POAL|nr:hypothetical protein GQ55_2G281200 [Panicum hallii var. hallii]PUZ71022.1 hypothetical protein GQ55_2G281200 [Panicum hallii var. hallii]